jgi:SprT protein
MRANLLLALFLYLQKMSTMLTNTLQDSAQERLSFLFENALKNPALEKVKRRFIQPTLTYNQRGRIAASAVLQKNINKINATLYAQNTHYFLSHIIAHELAHIMVYQLYGRRVKPHGIEWKKVMVEVFELPALVTHTLDVKDVAMREFPYKCGCQTVALSLIRHNRVVNKKQSYICRKCNEILTQVD